MRTGLETAFSAVATFDMVVNVAGSTASAPEGKNAACFRLTTMPLGVMLTSTFPVLISARTVHLRVTLALIVHSAAKHLGDGRRNTDRGAFLECFLYGFGNLFGF